MPGGTGPGGVPEEFPEGHWGIGGLSGPQRFMPHFESALSAITSHQRRVDTMRGIAPPGMSASGSNQTRDYLTQAVGLLRYGANVKGFTFSPSISILARDLRELALGLQDMREPLTKAVKTVMMPSIRKNFEVGGRPSWPALVTETTVKKHRAKKGYGPKPILVRKGTLKSVASSFAIWTITSISAYVEDLPEVVWYGRVHQGGKQERGAAGSGWFAGYRARAKAAMRADGSIKFATKSKVDKRAWDIFDAEQRSRRKKIQKGELRSGAGFRKGETNIPPRRFIVFQEEDFTAIQMIFYLWLDEQIVKKGRWPHPR